MADHPYRIFDPSGGIVLSAPECCRYSRSIESSILEAGYTIKLNGRKLTKTEVKKRGDRK